MALMIRDIPILTGQSAIDFELRRAENDRHVGQFVSKLCRKKMYEAIKEMHERSKAYKVIYP